MNLLFGIFVLVAIAASCFATGQEDFDRIHRKLFAQDAEILDRNQVIELLRQIDPLVKEKSADKNEITREDIEDLLDASVVRKDRCLSYIKFNESFRTLSLRRLFKQGDQTNPNDHIDQWNENIKNYINNCELEQFSKCLEEFKQDVKQVSAGQRQIVDEVLKNLPSTFIYRPELSQAILAALEPMLTQKSTKKFSLSNIMLKARIRDEFDAVFGDLVKSCKKIERSTKDHLAVVGNVSRRNETNLTVDEDTRLWVRRCDVCNRILRYTYPRILIANDGSMQEDDPLFEDLLAQVRRKY